MLWLARVAWVLLPVATGAAINDALHGWSGAPAAVASVSLWGAWTAGAVALLAPRPWGFTLLRVASAAVLGVAAASAPSASAGSAVLALAGSLAASVLALSSPIAHACAAGTAYAGEARFPLRAPLALLVGPLPLAAVLVAGGAITGPLLLADGRVATGVAAVAVGMPTAALFTRSLHGLSRRWVVLVRSGLVVADPLVLADPVLATREQVAALRRTRATGTPAPGVLDLRLAAAPGTVEVTLREPVVFGRRRGARNLEMIAAEIVLVAPLRPQALIDSFAAFPFA